MPFNLKKPCPDFDDHLISIQNLCKLIETALHLFHVGDQHVDDAAPGFVQGFVPDAGPEAGAVQRLAQLLQFLLPLRKDHIPLVLGYKVHLVHQTEDLCFRTFLKIEILEILEILEIAPG